LGGEGCHPAITAPILHQQSPVDLSGDLNQEERAMNWDQIEGNWKQFKGKVKEKWGQLTDDDLEQAAGRRDQVIGCLQKRYGWQRDQAERELDNLTTAW
jgi:uncharacterized protein YjbJ (UPF0337 family)